jgi:lipopolysaccharide export system protein LptA
LRKAGEKALVSAAYAMMAAIIAVAAVPALRPGSGPGPSPSGNGNGKEYSVPVDIRGKKVEYRAKEGKAVFTGGVTVTRGTSVLVSDELETIKDSSEAIARGHVLYRDAERKLELSCTEAHYAHGLKQVTAKGECLLTVGAKGEESVVIADEMEVFTDSKEAVANGKVRIIQGINEALCGTARLYGDDDRVVLTGRPVLRRPPHEFECDEAVTYFKAGRTILTGNVKGRLHTAKLDDLKPGPGRK